MPEKATMERAKEDLREGKAPSTAAGEFVKEEIDHVREGKHGVRSPQQAIAIGLSKARRAGVPLPPPKPGRTSPSTRKKAERRPLAAGEASRKEAQHDQPKIRREESRPHQRSNRTQHRRKESRKNA